MCVSGLPGVLSLDDREAGLLGLAIALNFIGDTADRSITKPIVFICLHNL